MQVATAKSVAQMTNNKPRYIFRERSEENKAGEET